MDPDARSAISNLGRAAQPLPSDGQVEHVGVPREGIVGGLDLERDRPFFRHVGKRRQETVSSKLVFITQRKGGLPDHILSLDISKEDT